MLKLETISASVDASEATLLMAAGIACAERWDGGWLAAGQIEVPPKARRKKQPARYQRVVNVSTSDSSVAVEDPPEDHTVMPVRTPEEWVEVTKRTACRYCGETELAWVRRPTGAWALAPIRPTANGGLEANRHERHQCQERCHRIVK